MTDHEESRKARVTRARFLASLGMTMFTNVFRHPATKFVVVGVATASLALVALGKDTIKTIELPQDNPAAKLKPGPGVETVNANCTSCHSTDYIVRQPGSDAQHWQDEVNKMIKVFGATVSDEDAKVMVNYLASSYGPAPAKMLPAAKPRVGTQHTKEAPKPR